MSLLLKRVLPLFVAALLLAYAFKDISFRAISAQFQQADYGLIGLVGLITVASYLIRGKRWQQPLLALGYRPTAFRATIAMQTGTISSMIVLGSGELTRCATLQRTDGVPMAQGIGSVVAERIIDLFMLALLLLLTLLLEFGRMRRYLAGLTLALPDPYLIAGLVAIILLLVLVAGLVFRNPNTQEHPLVLKAQNLGRGFRQGFMAIQRLPQPGLFIALTLLNQLTAWLGTYLLLIAVDSTKSLPPTAALTVMSVSSLGGLAVPTQGGIGTYHFLVSRALVLYGLTTAEGVVVATFMHAVGFAINLLLSSFSFMIVPLLITRKQSESARSLLK